MGSASEEMDALDLDEEEARPSGVNARSSERASKQEQDDWGDRTPPRAVSIYDLDEDMPTRMQASDEIAQFQELARERAASKPVVMSKPRAIPPPSVAARGVAFRSFPPPPGRESAPSIPPPSDGRAVPRESGPVLIARPVLAARTPPPEPIDVAALIEEIVATVPSAPPAATLPSPALAPAAAAVARRARLALVVGLALFVLAAAMVGALVWAGVLVVAS